jgi:hypothetical protein
MPLFAGAGRFKLSVGLLPKGAKQASARLFDALSEAAGGQGAGASLVADIAALRSVFGCK